MTTSMFSHVKDKNSIFTSRDEKTHYGNKNNPGISSIPIYKNGIYVIIQSKVRTSVLVSTQKNANRLLHFTSEFEFSQMHSWQEKRISGEHTVAERKKYSLPTNTSILGRK